MAAVYPNQYWSSNNSNTPSSPYTYTTHHQHQPQQQQYNNGSSSSAAGQVYQPGEMAAIYPVQYVQYHPHPHHQQQQQQHHHQQQQSTIMSKHSYNYDGNGFPTSPEQHPQQHLYGMAFQMHPSHHVMHHGSHGSVHGFPISPPLDDLTQSPASAINSSSDDSYNSPMLPMKRLFSDEPNYEDMTGSHESDEDELSESDEDAAAMMANEEQLAEEQLKAYLLPFINDILQTPASSSILHLISDCLTDQITVKNMLSKIKTICQDLKIEQIYQNLIQTFIKVDGDVRMVNYMIESGVDEDDLEFSKEIQLTQVSSDVTPKKRERKRESISKGLRSPPNKWTKEESQTLIRLVTENGDKQWKKIATRLGGGKTGAQCAQHWKRVLSPEIKKGSWDETEEEHLFALVEKHGQSWKNVAVEIKTRTDIQCRYQYYKATTSRETQWLAVEVEILTKKVQQLMLQNNGNPISFQAVSKHLARAKSTKIPRTALECKTKWNEIMLNQQQQPQQSPTFVVGVPVYYRDQSSNSTCSTNQQQYLPVQ